MLKQIVIPLCALAFLLLGAAPPLAFSRAEAQGFDLSFTVIHNQLQPYGRWVDSDRWGEVWIPRVAPGFFPYGTDGHWILTDAYGWVWDSDYGWGDIPFHYGRWVNDPSVGWLWIPGYVWGPGWVVWRSGGDYLGWMPMPPDDAFLQGQPDQFSFNAGFGNVDDYYGYSRWYGPSYNENLFASNWIFVPAGRFVDRDYMRYREPPTRCVTIIKKTVNVTHYTVVNNYVTNRSIDTNRVQRMAGRPIERVRPNATTRWARYVTPVDRGREADRTMTSQHPHGRGYAQSAPRTQGSATQPALPNVSRGPQTLQGNRPPPKTPPAPPTTMHNPPHPGSAQQRGTPPNFAPPPKPGPQQPPPSNGHAGPPPHFNSAAVPPNKTPPKPNSQQPHTGYAPSAHGPAPTTNSNGHPPSHKGKQPPPKKDEHENQDQQDHANQP